MTACVNRHTNLVFHSCPSERCQHCPSRAAQHGNSSAPTPFHSVRWSRNPSPSQFPHSWRRRPKAPPPPELRINGTSPSATSSAPNRPIHPEMPPGPQICTSSRVPPRVAVAGLKVLSVDDRAVQALCHIADGLCSAPQVRHAIGRRPDCRNTRDIPFR
jgi:hypothetical protein